MAASNTTRVTLSGAPGTWTKLVDGTTNGLFAFIQHHAGPAVELFYGPTASAPAQGSEGFMLYPRGVHGGGDIVNLTLLAADSVWARSSDPTTKIDVAVRAS